MGEANKAIDQLISGIKNLKTSFKNVNNPKLSKQIKDTVGIGTALKKTFNFSAIYLGARQALSTLKEMTDASVDYTETTNLFEVSMGKVVDEYGKLDTEASKYYLKASSFQDKLSEKLGVNIEESMRYQALFNSMTKSMGLGANYAYTLSENMTKLGYDLASLYNIDTESAMTKLRAGLAGQTEPLRELGLDITEQSLKSVAQSLGIKESIRNMSQAEKAVLRYITVLRQAQIAQGDFARTMDSPANQLRIFNAQITAFKRNMGNLWQGLLGNVLPYVNAIMMVINELLKMVAKLFGFEVQGQPANISTSIGAGDLANDLDDANKKAKKLKNQLMGFDEINNITMDNEKTSGESSGGGTGIDQRLLDALKGYDNLMDSVSNKATEIRDKMLEWLGFERNDDGTWKLKEGLTNFEKILDVAKLIGVAIGTWKISSAVTNLLKNLGILKGHQSFQLAFGITLLATGVFAQYKGTKHLLNGDVDIFTLLETFLGTGAGAFGIVNILKATKLGKSLSLGNKLKVGFGLMLGIQGVQVFLDGINEGDIKKTLLGALESVTSFSVALNGLFGGKFLQGIKNITSGFSNVSSAINISTGAVGKHATAITGATKSMGSFAKTGATVVAGLAGIAAGSALTYATMKDLTTGQIEAGEAALKLTAGLGAATASGALAGSQFGTMGTIIGGVIGLTTSAVTAFMGYKDGIESLNIPTSTLTEEISELTEEIESNRQAHESNVKSIKDTYESQMVEAEYAEQLTNQLKGLIDVNGRVKKGSEERANFILGELSNALGEEYKLNGNIITKNGEVVDSYRELRDGIEETIKAKKKEAEETANLELYKESLKESIRLERERTKIQEDYAKAEKEYNDLKAKGLSEWTLNHDESCKQIAQNYIELGDKLTQNGEDLLKAKEDTIAYSQAMTDDMIESSGMISETMLQQGEIYSTTLQNMFENNKSKWEENFTYLSDAMKANMLAQTTTLDTYGPELQQKWADMATNSASNFLTGISQVQPNVQAQILATITTTDNLNPEMVTAWANLASNSYDEFKKAIAQIDPTVQDEILKTMTTTQGLTETTSQAWADLANTSKDRYNTALSSIDSDTAREIQTAVDAINGKQSDMNTAGYNIAEEGVEGAQSKVDDPQNGIKSVGNWFVQGFINAISSGSVLNSVFRAGYELVNSALKGGNERQKTGSPAKETIKMGNFYTEGYIVGMKKKSPEVKKVARNLVGTALEELNEINQNGFKINPQDFKVNTSQFIDYGTISGNIRTQANLEMRDLSQEVKQAIVEGMKNSRLSIEIEGKADKDGIFKVVQTGAKEFYLQTGQPAFEF